MTEFGDIFDYQLSAMGFECLTLAFVTIYGLAIAWLVTSPKPNGFNFFRAP
jgi:hypothetical protein